MSFLEGGLGIVCDGDECGARVDYPIALHAILRPYRKTARQSIEGWLFVTEQGGYRHFCPNCSLGYLNALQDRPITASSSAPTAADSEGNDIGKASGITPEATPSALAAARPGRAAVFEKYGIAHSADETRTLREVCAERQIDLQTVLYALNAADAVETHRVEGPDWTTASLPHLIDHIIRRHHDYLREALPCLQFLIQKTRNAYGERYPELKPLAVTFAEFRGALELHMDREERILFPLCRDSKPAGSPSNAQTRRLQEAMQEIEGEHHHIEETLRAIRTLMHDYIAPADACATFRVILDGLTELETDLHQHIHKEDILFPRAIVTKGRSSDRRI